MSESDGLGKLPPPVPPKLSPYRKSQTWPSKYQDNKVANHSFDTAPTLTRTPWEQQRGPQRTSSRSSRGSFGKPKITTKSIFQRLPPEVQSRTLYQLEATYTSGHVVNVAKLQTDLRSLCRIDKSWHRVAQEHLYSDLWLPTSKVPKKRRFALQTPRSKLQVLSETLKKSPWLATVVHRIRITSELAGELTAERVNESSENPVLQNLLDIIQLCPNVEHFSGYVPPIGPSTILLTEALSSRSQLKSHSWNLDPRKAVLPNLGRFIVNHDNWKQLETLTISANRGVDLGHGAISAVLARLPALKNLMISGMHEKDFHDEALLNLPALKSLRLENLVGLTDHGVRQMAFTRLRLSLRSLTLVGLELVSLQTVQALLTHLVLLQRFAFVQETCPEPPADINLADNPLPLSSRSLKQLHWDCLLPGLATNIFAEAIATGKFPKLRMVKVPCDYEGAIQALCKPIRRERLTSAELEYLARQSGEKHVRSLQLAQIEAQLRVRKSRQRSLEEPALQDGSTQVQSVPTVGRFLGSASSQIEYSLESDFGLHALTIFDDIAVPVAVVEENANMEQKLDAGLLF